MWKILVFQNFQGYVPLIAFLNSRVTLDSLPQISLDLCEFM